MKIVAQSKDKMFEKNPCSKNIKKHKKDKKKNFEKLMSEKAAVQGESV